MKKSDREEWLDRMPPKPSGGKENGMMDTNELKNLAIRYGDLYGAEVELVIKTAARELATLRAENERLQKVAWAGNGLVQFGIEHSKDCKSRSEWGECYCDCGRDDFVLAFIRAWDEWKKGGAE